MTAEPLAGRVVLGIRAFLALMLGLVAVFLPGTTTVLVVRLRSLAAAATIQPPGGDPVSIVGT